MPGRVTEVAPVRFSHLAQVAGIQVRPGELAEFTQRSHMPLQRSRKDPLNHQVVIIAAEIHRCTCRRVRTTTKARRSDRSLHELVAWKHGAVLLWMEVPGDHRAEGNSQR